MPISLKAQLGGATSLASGLFAPESVGGFKQGIIVFDYTPGTKVFTVPEGVSKLRVAVVGAGGGGALGSGAGGGYEEKIIDVTAGETFTYTVGAGGDPGVVATATSAGPGSTTSFGGLISATGGAGGNGSTGGTPPAGGVGTGGNVSTSGGPGTVATSTQYYPAGAASGHRYGNGTAGAAVSGSVHGTPGGSWQRTPERTLLRDDGWGLGVTQFQAPIWRLVNAATAFVAPGVGVPAYNGSYVHANYGSGGAYNTAPGPGGGCSGPYRGGAGVVIVEVLK